MEKRIFVVSTQRLLTLLQYLLILSEYSLTIYGLTSITLAISRSIADNRSAYVSFFSFYHIDLNLIGPHVSLPLARQRNHALLSLLNYRLLDIYHGKTFQAQPPNPLSADI